VWDVEWSPPNRGRIIFYPPPMVCCRHRRYTKACIVIRKQLEQWQRLQHTLAAGATIAKATLDEAPDGIDEADLKAMATGLRRGRLKTLVRELKKQGIDPEHVNPEDFCQYRAPTDLDLREDQHWWSILTDQHPRRAHRPHKRDFDYLLISELTDAGWGVTSSCEFLRDVLSYCFGIKEHFENLRQRWYQHRTKWNVPRARLRALLPDDPSLP
jgi:hypothetical protein